MPLVDGLYSILFEQRSITEVISALMGNSEGADVEFVDPSRWQ
jgi:glycerol-3-phosphate dehydrogenase